MSDDDSYSLDDDFASQDGRRIADLPRICEEPDTESISSIHADIASDQRKHGDNTSMGNTVEAGHDLCGERKCDDSHDSYSYDDDFSNAQQPSRLSSGEQINTDKAASEVEQYKDDAKAAVVNLDDANDSYSMDGDFASVSQRTVLSSSSPKECILTNDSKPIPCHTGAHTTDVKQMKVDVKESAGIYGHIDHVIANETLLDGHAEKAEPKRHQFHISNDSYSLDDDFASAEEERCRNADRAVDHTVTQAKEQVNTSSILLDKDSASSKQEKESSVGSESKRHDSRSVSTVNAAANDEYDSAMRKLQMKLQTNPWQDRRMPEKEIEESKEDPKDNRGGPKVAQRKKPKKAPLPRCATLTTKSRTRQTINNAETTTETKKVKKKYSKQRLTELTQPRKHHMYKQQAENDDTEHKKKVITRKISQDEFLDRMETMERERKKKVEYTAAEAAYNRKIDADKFKCFKCGRVQSYSEMIAESMVCQNDKCFKKKHLYQKTQRKPKDFLERYDRSSQRRNMKIDEILEERRSSLTSQCLAKSHHQKTLMRKVSKNGQDFMQRMEKDINARKTKTMRLGELIDESLSSSCTFKPSLNISDHMIRGRKGGINSLAVPSRRYTSTFDELLEESERKQGRQKARSKKRSPIESLWQQKPSRRTYDEAKMKKNFHLGY